MLSFPASLRRVAGCGLLMVALGVLLARPAPALARSAYVTITGSDEVSVIDTATNQTVGAPIPVASAPFGIAITPDGARAYVADLNSNDVSVVDTATNQTLGAPIPVGANPFLGVAVTPDGKWAYVPNQASSDVSVIDTATNQTVGASIPVGSGPIGVAITPNGKRAYVSSIGSNDVSVIDTATNQALGAPIDVGGSSAGVAITPDGSRAYVANNGSGDVSVIDTETNQTVGAPIAVGAGPVGVAITPDGSRAYVTNQSSGDVSVINTATNQTIGAPIVVGAAPVTAAITPDGAGVYVINNGSNSVSVIDTATNQTVGAPISLDSGPVGIAIVPDQPPHASFSDPSAPVGAKVTFSGAASFDPDGKVSNYSWDFGDGKSAQSASPTTTHVFSRRGHFAAKLTVTDNEGCSTSLIYTGQTAYCNGSAVAAFTRTLKVGFPRVRLKCPAEARGACSLSARAVSRRTHGKIESRAARAKVRPGKSKIVALKVKKAFRAKLGRVKHVLTRQRVRVNDHPRTRYQRLRLKRP